MIEKVAERRSMFFRPAKTSETKRQVSAANISQLGIIVSSKNPPLKPGLIDRFIIAADMGDLKPLIIVNKIDLGRPEIADELEKGYSNIGVPILFISAETGEGFTKLSELVKDERTIFAGHSGVGKSTILNRLVPGLNIKVGEVSKYSDKGVHTTSNIEMYEIPDGGFVVDSPGIKILRLWELKQEDLPYYYKEMEDCLNLCRFTGCSHTHEPDCAVKDALDKGLIPKFRYENYVTIYKSLEQIH
ncbi:MAG: ribosome small subunit-dependent GTPase A [candidate division Zixibacteria bacterium]|nr:ribosome small subunit-dependent GTPase A [candidate division Zixibacteria bacterium]